MVKRTQCHTFHPSYFVYTVQFRGRHPSLERFSSHKAETLCPSSTNCLCAAPLSPWPPPSCLLSLWIFWLLRVSHWSVVIQCLSFCDWLISLNTMSSRFIQVVACVRVSFQGLPGGSGGKESPSFLRLNDAPWYVCTCTTLCSSSHPLPVGHLGFSNCE